MKPSTLVPKHSSGLTRPILRHVSRQGIATQELDRLKGDRERVVILGSGWAGYTFSRQLNLKKYQPVVVSPRSYFAFTPLLASTAVGTLEFRTAIESVRARGSGVEFFQGWADDVNFSKKLLTVEESAIAGDSSKALSPSLSSDPHTPDSLPIKSVAEPLSKKGRTFDLKYDKLVVAVGCYSQTFNTPGVRENAFFLKDVSDARLIRKRILDCFELASLPSSSEQMRKQLLNFAVVGGGPTGVEFSAELFDLCHEDLSKLYPDLLKYVKISIYDVAPQILPMFEESLAKYAVKTFRRDGIQVKTQHHIQELKRGFPNLGTTEGDQSPQQGASGFTLVTKEEGEVGVGMCVWSTGLMMNPFIQKALNEVHTYPTSSAQLLSPEETITASSTPLTSPESQKWILKRHPKTGGLMVDDHFRVKLVLQPTPSFSSSSTNKETKASVTTTSNQAEAHMNDVFALGDVSVLEGSSLPATAQVANQEARWLGKQFNKGDLGQEKGFSFRNMGVMTYLGNWRAIMQTGGKNEVKGWAAWVIWRGAYLTQTISYRNKLLIPVYWMVNWIFGRDISRF